MFRISLPIRILGQLGYKYLDIFKRMFPHLPQRKFTRIDDFYELIVCCRTYQKILANSSLKLLLCRRLIGFGNFHFRKEHNFFMTMINRIYRDLNPIPNSGSLVPRLITSRFYTSVNSMKFHEIYPIMAVASSSCFIWQIKSDNTFEFVSSLQNLPTCAFVIAVAFHRKFPILAASLNDGTVLLVEFNIDGTNPKIFHTISIQKGTIWSIVFHPIQ